MSSGLIRHYATSELGLHCLHLSLEQVSRREKRHVRILTSRLLGKTRNSKGMAMLAGYQKRRTRFSIYHALLADLTGKKTAKQMKNRHNFCVNLLTSSMSIVHLEFSLKSRSKMSMKFSLHIYETTFIRNSQVTTCFYTFTTVSIDKFATGALLT